LGAYGRIIHLQPLAWEDDYPKIGLDDDGDGIGEPVMKYKKPSLKLSKVNFGSKFYDEFNTPKMNLAWQWHANYNDSWYTLNEKKGILRLNLMKAPFGFRNLWDVPNLLLQKIPAEAFSVTTEIEFHPKLNNDMSGLIVMGKDYSYLAIKRDGNKIKLVKCNCSDADKKGNELIEESVDISNTKMTLKADVKKGALCTFSYSPDGKTFKIIGKEFAAKEGLWIGAKIGLFALSPNSQTLNGYADYEYFRIDK
jgi:beta-xylosidase